MFKAPLSGCYPRLTLLFVLRILLLCKSFWGKSGKEIELIQEFGKDVLNILTVIETKKKDKGIDTNARWIADGVNNYTGLKYKDILFHLVPELSTHESR